jgi:hypothetical protein
VTAPYELRPAVLVNKALGSAPYVCQPLTDRAGYRCGACGRGILFPGQRDICRVCKASILPVVGQGVPDHRRIPPAGGVKSTIEALHVAQGWDVLVSVRSLRGEFRGQPIDGARALVFAWQALSETIRDALGQDLTLLVARINDTPSRPEGS